MKFMKRVGFVGLLGLAAGLGGTAVAQQSEYQAHWAVTTLMSQTRGVDLQSQIDLSRTSIKRDAVIMYESWLGNFPYAGPHMAEQGDFMQRHLAKIGRDLTQFIPDPNFSGYAIIDYETWFPAWSRLNNVKSDKPEDFRDYDFKDDWEDYMKRARPQILAGLAGDARERVLATTYNDACKRFYLATLNECKRLRPKAKWGFYGFPYREYYVDYVPFAARWKDANTNDLQWMWDAVDVVFPSVYSVKITVDGRQPAAGQPENTPEVNARYMSENVKEAIRVAKGKPVMAFIHFRYHPCVGKDAGKLVTDTVLRQFAEVPKQAGAQGIMIWDAIGSDVALREIRDITLNRFAPMMDRVAVAPQASQPRVAAAPTAKPAAPKATVLPNGQVVVSTAKPAAKVATVPAN
jgi:hypothetical protein